MRCGLFSATLLVLCLQGVGTSSSFAEPQEDLRALYEKGADLLDGYQGEREVLTEAETYFQKIIQQDPDSPYGPLGISRMYREVAHRYGNTFDETLLREKALPLALEAKRLGPDVADVHAALASIYAPLKQLSEAKAAVNEALRLDPNSARCQLVLGQVLAYEDKVSEAAAQYERALTRPASPKLQVGVLSRLAHCYKALGNSQKAIEVFNRGLALQGKSPWLYNDLGTLYIDLGEYEKAIEVLTRAVELGLPVSQYNLSIAKGQLDFRLGLSSYNENKLEEARVYFERVVALAPATAAKSYDYLSLIAEKFEGAYQKALQYAEQEIKADPRSPSGYYQAGRVLRLSGQKERAMEYFRKCLELDPESRWSVAIKRTMPELR